MSQILQFRTEKDYSILVEVTEANVDEIQEAAISDTIVQANQSFEEAIDKIRFIGGTIVDRLSTLSQRPSEVEVEFSLKMSAESGVIIATGKVEANYTVKLKWMNEKDSD